MAGIKFQCSNCGQHLEAPPEAAGCALACPSCQSSIRVPSTTASELLCAICQNTIRSDESRSACPGCAAEYHADCWQENGGCAVYGCAQVPQVEQRRAIEIPISYWGLENKPCPSCNQEILAAAIRCRHCGATFSSARPEDADEFQDRTAFQEQLPGMKRMVIWIFVFSIVPCLAPIGAIWGVIWYSSNRRRIGMLPGMFGAILKIGLAVALGQCALILLMTALYSLTKH
ncbi:MAG: RING finger protein [Verrucomicrobiota bacterium]